MDSTTTLRTIALEHPATIRVFEHFQLDYCCGGNRPLGEICAEKCIAAEVVLAALAEAVDREAGRGGSLQRHLCRAHPAHRPNASRVHSQRVAAAPGHGGAGGFKAQPNPS